jgi:hypothetical protein
MMAHVTISVFFPALPVHLTAALTMCRAWTSRASRLSDGRWVSTDDIVAAPRQGRKRMAYHSDKLTAMALVDDGLASIGGANVHAPGCPGQRCLTWMRGGSTTTAAS